MLCDKVCQANANKETQKFECQVCQIAAKRIAALKKQLHTVINTSKVTALRQQARAALDSLEAYWAKVKTYEKNKIEAALQQQEAQVKKIVSAAFAKEEAKVHRAWVAYLAWLVLILLALQVTLPSSTEKELNTAVKVLVALTLLLYIPPSCRAPYDKVALPVATLAFFIYALDTYGHLGERKEKN